MAVTYTELAQTVVNTIVSSIMDAPPQHKLAKFYLIDSIIKQPAKGFYIPLFESQLISFFIPTFTQVDLNV